MLHQIARLDQTASLNPKRTANRPGQAGRLRSTITALLPIALLLLCARIPARAAGSLPQQKPAGLSGSWELTWIRFGQTNVDRLELEQSGDKISGKGFGLIAEGSFKDSKLELNVLGDDKKVVASFTGTLRGDELSGVIKMDTDEFPWTARRAAARPADAPKVHNFEPKEFHRHFSATIAPALKIFPGDTVDTETVDAGGVDKAGAHRSMGGNPLTGPFYVEGAVRGDTLVVHFNRIRLNRDWAESGSGISPNAVNPGYNVDRRPVKDFDSKWTLDKEHGVARLAKPTDKLKDFTVPLQPMLGCVGVAPGGNQAILSGELGNYGGNMDYNQIREGTTLYFPVNQAGALLYVGDGHAAQGDGELTGDALETSMEVEFAVDLIRGKAMGGPRAENDEYLMAIGIANSLPEALQRATTMLARWLETDYKLNPSEVAMVLGFAIHYDIAEVVDPHVNVVAKIKKSSLVGLKKSDQ
jgi:acetamidase/formamidase